MSQSPRRKLNRKNIQRQQNPVNQEINKHIFDKIFTPNYRIHEKVNCKCDICQNELGSKLKRVSTYQRLKQSKSVMLLKKSNMKQLLKLLLPKNKKIGFKILIPQICFYEGGQPESVFITFKDEIKQVKFEKLTQLQVLNTFLEQNKIYKDTLKVIFEKEIMKFIDSTKQVHQKYVEALLPLWKPGGSDVQKGFNMLKYHKDNRLLMNSIQQHRDKESDEVCLIRYLDGNFNILNQIQFQKLMKGNKKSNSTIQLIQSYIKPKRQSDSILVSQFDIEKPIVNKYLYQKALLQIQIMLCILPQLSELYVTQQSLQEFNISLKQNPHEYILYQTYKIIHYLQKQADIQTEYIKLSWLINDVNLFFMNGVLEFQYEKLEYETLKKMTKKQLEKVKNKVKQSKQIQNYLQSIWEEKKKQKNISKSSEKKYISTRSNQVFHFLYPQKNFQELISKQSHQFQKSVLNLTATTRQSFNRTHQSKRPNKRIKLWCRQQPY